MFSLTMRNLMFRKLRTILTVIGIAAPVMMMVFLGSVTSFIVDDITTELSRYAGQVHVRPPTPGVKTRSAASSMLGLSSDQAKAVLAEAGQYDAARTSPILYMEIKPSQYPNGPAELTMIGVEPGHEAAVLSGVRMQAGTMKLAAESDAIIGPGLAAERGVGVGDALEMDGRAFQVRGVLKSDAGILNGLLLVPLRTAQAFGRREDKVSALWIGYSDLARVQPARQALQAAFADLDVVTQDDMLAAAQETLADQKSFFGMMNGTVLFTAAVIIVLVMFAVVMERTREIGTLRAIGVPRWQVVTGLMQEATLMTGLGGLLGCVSAVPILKWTFGSDDSLAGIFQMALPNLGPALLTAVLIGLVGGAYPAWRAAKVDPITALRYE